MPKRKPEQAPRKRNVVARDAQPQPSAGPMKDKRRLSRQEQRLRDKREAEKAAAVDE